ncbi:MAG: MHS family MFS transporter [Yaniella sp.]|uniref:MFS transporter n=1 Tax=Yaniella sp. TaxID=2773929 RepID=UPI002649F69E|nr:MFS transporter [Yaniella sp.]MDN5704106.1 MHS family MFS transporter [Yaniella sp.]MDN5731091.1 MHS family MFS transporter [Yaniella sp.]MDN5742543.1 MHS family MFS transporter [Yaniella sp.]MDN5814599.1 MHS family MFS transporter [Yaniella sp.]MDN5817538.1 MHS family MFS transporter [Yaniella sp.]
MTTTSHNGRTRAEERRVLAGTLVGTTIEWYDFFIYAQAAAFVLAPLFFEPLAADNAGLAQILSWASIGISFLFRPLGAVVAGHLGDKYGRKLVLVVTLIGMGGATTAIGLLPTYAAIGVGAPILLILMRVLQGFSAGGEWGGAALMAVEHAPTNKRSFFGSYPQIGVPLGMLLATGFMFILTSSMSSEQFMDWGWRIPFISSVVLILVGYLIRRAVSESPVFTEMQERRRDSSAPLGELLRKHKRPVLLAALIFAGNNAAGYLVIAFFASYGANVLDMPRSATLIASLVGGVGWFAFTLFGGWIGDKIGKRKTFIIGYLWIIAWAIPMWFLIDTASLPLFTVAIFVLTIGLGPSYGPQSALYAEMFPASVRYSGVSIGYAFGSIIGGAFAPMISQFILNATGQSWMIGLYIAGISTVSLIGVLLVPKSVEGRDLNDTDTGDITAPDEDPRTIQATV